MERVAFLIENSGQRIGCLLNPEGLTVRRTAGVARRHHVANPVASADLTDDPLLYTGGGWTEIELDLLFEVSLAGSTIETADVRTLTLPLWELAENRRDEQGRLRPPLVRFVWGKAWNVPGIITAVAERLDAFGPNGVPARSWLRMRFVRVTSADPPQPPVPESVEALEKLLPVAASAASSEPANKPEPDRAVEITGGPDSQVTDSSVPTRLDELAYRYLGDAAKWRLIAWFNDVVDPLRVTAGTLLHIPPPPAGGAR
jgi:hypothetical protein